MSIVWGVSALRLPFLGRGKESQDAAALDVHAEYTGWLVTTEDKARLVLVEFTDGWYARETSDGSSWRWTQPTAMLSFLNPRRAAVLHLDYDAHTDLFKDPPRTSRSPSVITLHGPSHQTPPADSKPTSCARLAAR